MTNKLTLEQARDELAAAIALAAHATSKTAVAMSQSIGYWQGRVAGLAHEQLVACKRELWFTDEWATVSSGSTPPRSHVVAWFAKTRDCVILERDGSLICSACKSGSCIHCATVAEFGCDKFGHALAVAARR